MPPNLPLPFDALRPFKSRREAFTPRDTIPWEAQANQLLRCQTETGFMGLRSYTEIDRHVARLIQILNLPPGASILDIACGPGLYSHRLGEAGYQVTGLDIAQPLLDYAQRRADRQKLPCTYRCCSLLNLQTATQFFGAFEAVLLINSTINLLTSQELTRALQGIRAALKPGGHFIGEFQTLPPDFAATAPQTKETLSLLEQSPWHQEFHALLTRQLTFPLHHEQVTHYLLLPAGSPPSEYWTRTTLYAPATLQAIMAQHGLAGQQIFGPTLDQVYQPSDSLCFLWAT